MTKYLRVKNFWDYQNADAWKKARQNRGGHRHPAWCKLYVARDLELDAEKPVVRLVFYELLRLATVCENVIPNDISTIANAISMPRQAVGEAIPRLLKGGWLSESASARRSREPSRKFRAQTEIEIREDIKKQNKGPTRESLAYTYPEFAAAKLLKELTDKDPHTERTIESVSKRYRLTEADFGLARDAASGPGVLSPAAVAISVLVQRGQERQDSKQEVA